VHALPRQGSPGRSSRGPPDYPLDATSQWQSRPRSTLRTTPWSEPCLPSDDGLGATWGLLARAGARATRGASRWPDSGRCAAARGTDGRHTVTQAEHCVENCFRDKSLRSPRLRWGLHSADGDRWGPPEQLPAAHCHTQCRVAVAISAGAPRSRLYACPRPSHGERSPSNPSFVLPRAPARPKHEPARRHPLVRSSAHKTTTMPICYAFCPCVL
jgi:hypothetical protein